MHALVITIPMASVSQLYKLSESKTRHEIEILAWYCSTILPGYFFDVNKKEKEALQVK